MVAGVHDWNVVVSVVEDGYSAGKQWLQRYGAIAGTDYYNVLVMKVEDVQAFPEVLRQALAAEPASTAWLGRIMPLSRTFQFQNAEEFERQARVAVQPWVEAVRGKRFHVRMHRRGFKGRLSSQHEELFLDHYLSGTPDRARPRIDFEDPDVIIALETVGQRGGVSCWTRAQRQRYPFLKLD